MNTPQPHMLAQWAYNELVGTQTGHRAMLEPLIPRERTEYSDLDMQIADVIAQGYTEQRRIKKLIEDLIDPPDNVFPITQEPIAQTLFFYDNQEGKLILTHDLTMTVNNVNDCNLSDTVDIIDQNHIGVPIQSIANNLPDNLIGTQGNDH